MAAVEVLLAKADRERHQIPDLLLFDLMALNDVPFSVSGAWEDELLAATNLGIGELLEGLERGLAKSKVALAWLSCKMADLDVKDFASFDIAWRHVKVREVKAKRSDVGPPQSGSSEPLSEEAP